MTVPHAPETDPAAPRAPVVARPQPPAWAGALVGLLAAAVAVTTGLLTAGWLGVVGPLDAVGSSFIDRTPAWLKELAISLFGTNDKLALRVGMVVVLTALAVAVGVLAMRRPGVGVAGIVVLGVVALAAALERPGQPPAVVVPPFVAVATGIVTMRLLFRYLTDTWTASLSPGGNRTSQRWDRRQFLGVSGAAALVAVGAGVTAQLLERRRVDRRGDAVLEALPPVEAEMPPPAGTLDDLSGVTQFITPNDDFYRIDTALRFPSVNLEDWSVRVHGLVDREISLSYADLLDRPMVERTITLCCVSNEVGGSLIGNAVWQGVLLGPLLEEAGVQPGAEQVLSESLDGFTSGFPVEVAMDGRDAMLVVGMNGEPLPIAHGYPARLVVPGLYGYVSATKWLSRIELTTWDAEGYWIPRGWSRLGPVKTQSRIDVPRRGEEVQAGTVAIAGVAWAQHRGVEKVEVRIDEGEWHEARLADDAGIDVWRQWVYEWEARPGEYTLQVRATDGNGDTQTDRVSSVAPDGATGHHTRRVAVTA